MSKNIAVRNTSNNVQRFINGFRKLSAQRNNYQTWDDVISLFAITLANQSSLWYKDDKKLKAVWEERENEYLRIINKYDKKEQRLFPQMFALLVDEFAENPEQDLLGSIYMQLEIGSKNLGQFFTPYDICKMMSSITFDKKSIAKQVHTKGYVSINDCACGGGATLIAAAAECSRLFKKLNYQNHCFFVAQDIDKTSALMCYIQLSLIGVAGYVVIGNTLTDPYASKIFNDYPQDVFFTPVYFDSVWTMRRLFHGLDIMMCKKESEAKQNV